MSVEAGSSMQTKLVVGGMGYMGSPVNKKMQVSVNKCLEGFTNDAVTILAGKFIQRGTF